MVGKHCPSRTKLDSIPHISRRRSSLRKQSKGSSKSGGRKEHKRPEVSGVTAEKHMAQQDTAPSWANRKHTLKMGCFHCYYLAHLTCDQMKGYKAQQRQVKPQSEEIEQMKEAWLDRTPALAFSDHYGERREQEK